MNLSLLLVCLWVVTAGLLSMIPSRRKHWPLAYALMVAGLPILGYVYWVSGAWAALAAIGVGALVLRWPLRYLWRRVLRAVGPRGVAR